MKACYRVEIEQEEDGRFLAEVVDLPGVMAYGDTADPGLAHVQARPCACSPIASTMTRGPAAR